MELGALVVTQIVEGQRQIDRLAEGGVAVTAAAWVKEGDSGEWFLYLATPLVRKAGLKRPAYRRVNEVVRPMQADGFWVDPLEIKVIAPHDPVAKGIAAMRDRYSGSIGTRFRGSRLGQVATDGVYVYPQPSVAT